MKVARVASLLAALAGATAAHADPPERSPRPQERPEAGIPGTQAPGQPVSSPIVKTPTGFVQYIPSARTPSGRIAVFFGGGTRPEPRSPGRAAAFQRSAAATQIMRPPATPSKMGRVCGSGAIIGRPVPPVKGRLKGCGIKDPVQIVQVSGVALSQGSTMTCEAAQALNLWVDKGLKPAVGRMGGGVQSLRVVAHYSCRTRNSKTGARISEHGKGRAIDIADIRLQDGTTLSVLKDWGKGKKGRALKTAHRAACGPFGTVLGPNADRYHRDHFHFDVARYRSGPYCR